jgi:hypothetical protein
MDMNYSGMAGISWTGHGKRRGYLGKGHLLRLSCHFAQLTNLTREGYTAITLPGMSRAIGRNEPAHHPRGVKAGAQTEVCMTLGGELSLVL